MFFRCLPVYLPSVGASYTYSRWYRVIRFSLSVPPLGEPAGRNNEIAPNRCARLSMIARKLPGAAGCARVVSSIRAIKGGIDDGDGDFCFVLFFFAIGSGCCYCGEGISVLIARKRSV